MTNTEIPFSHQLLGHLVARSNNPIARRTVIGTAVATRQKPDALYIGVIEADGSRVFYPEFALVAVDVKATASQRTSAIASALQEHGT